MAFNYAGCREDLVMNYGLTNDDLHILKYISICFNFENIEHLEMNGKIFICIKTSKIMNDNPRLRIKERALTTKIDILEQKGMIEKFVKCADNTKIKKTYYHLTDRYNSLFFSDDIENTGIFNLEMAVENEKPKTTNDKKIEISESCQELLDYWNSKKIIIHTTISKNLVETINKSLKENTIDEIKKYIDRYDKVLKDKDYYFNYKWTLIQFLKQKNCMNDFRDDGSKWNSYLNGTLKTRENKETISKEYEEWLCKGEI